MKKKETGGRGGIKSVFRVLICAFLLIAAAAAAVLLFATLTEYRPADTEALAVVKAADAGPEDADNKDTGETETAEAGFSDTALHEGGTLRVVTWNIGYGALGDNADFFMDGGSMVQTADTARVEENMKGITQGLSDLDADIILLQEVDRDSARSHHIDETALVLDGVQKMTDWTFAWNFRTPFVPYPVPPIGKVSSGLMTLSAFSIEEAERVQLPCPFSWPVRTVNLKRCAAVHRIPVENSGHELVIINLHLEAYDSGEGKAAQTQMLRELLQKERDAGNYVIAGGDFNQVFSNTDASAYPVYGYWQPGVIDAEEFPEGWQLLMDSDHPTCRSLDRPLDGADTDSFQFYMIDGFIISDNVEVLNIRTMDKGFVCTDHNPVLAEVRLGKDG